jgi:hypothetical protein
MGSVISFVFSLFICLKLKDKTQSEPIHSYASDMCAIEPITGWNHMVTNIDTSQSVGFNGNEDFGYAISFCQGKNFASLVQRALLNS